MRRLTLIVLAACLVTAACSGTDVLSPASVAGTYALTTVNGLAVPITGPASASTGVVLSGAIVLGADGSATRRITYGPPGIPEGQTYRQTTVYKFSAK